ncbi:MAG TPA: ATP-grasp domain-containing protein [Steroidobacteraceae bacterium]|nr:ATP-grasp domain-containing protein [Steroidobacteraceae bacterium]
MHVIFVEPAFPHNQRQFVRALATVGARVIGIGERPAAGLDDELKSWLTEYVQIGSVVHEPSLLEAVRRVQRQIWVDRMEATVEAHIMPAAKVREACGIPGTSVRTAWLCRDKPSMKETLRAAGIPCAQSASVDNAAAARVFAEAVGYPLIFKPRAGAGASGTTRIDNDSQLEHAIRSFGVDRGQSIAVEEFIEGHEGFLDTLTIRGDVAHEFVSHYYPNVLEAMRERWISPQIVATNRIQAEGYDEVKRLARRVIAALEIGTSATHMEWFFGAKGLKFSEIGCRPPGVGQWDVYSAANEFDIYREWAMAIVHGTTSQALSRRYSCGMIALRPSRDGRIAGYDGLDRIDREFGEWIVAAHFPAAGTPTQPVEAGYMANAWMRVRHPDYDHLRHILNTIGETVKVWAQ